MQILIGVFFWCFGICTCLFFSLVFVVVLVVIQKHWIGKFWKQGTKGNNIKQTNVPDIRLRFRYELVMEEKNWILGLHPPTFPSVVIAKKPNFISRAPITSNTSNYDRKQSDTSVTTKNKHKKNKNNNTSSVEESNTPKKRRSNSEDSTILGGGLNSGMKLGNSDDMVRVSSTGAAVRRLTNISPTASMDQDLLTPVSDSGKNGEILQSMRHQQHGSRSSYILGGLTPQGTKRTKIRANETAHSNMNLISANTNTDQNENKNENGEEKDNGDSNSNGNSKTRTNTNTNPNRRNHRSLSPIGKNDASGYVRPIARRSSSVINQAARYDPSVTDSPSMEIDLRSYDMSLNQSKSKYGGRKVNSISESDENSLMLDGIIDKNSKTRTSLNIMPGVEVRIDWKQLFGKNVLFFGISTAMLGMGFAGGYLFGKMNDNKDKK